MNKQQAIASMISGNKITHEYFSSNEYIYMKDGKIISEDGVVHDEFWQIRHQECWNTNWSIY